MKFFLFGFLGAMSLAALSATAETTCPDSVPLSPFSIAKASLHSAQGWGWVFGYKEPQGYVAAPGEKITALLDITGADGALLAQSLVAEFPRNGHHYTLSKDNQQIATALGSSDNEDGEKITIKICGKDAATLESSAKSEGDQQLYSLTLVTGLKLTYQLERHPPELLARTSAAVVDELANEQGEVLVKLTENFDHVRYGAQLSSVSVEPVSPNPALDQRLAEIVAAQVFSRFR